MRRKKLVYSILSVTLAVPIVLVGRTESVLAAAESKAINFVQSTPVIAQEAIVETVLFFETENFAVRIFRRGEDLFMNLFNKQTGIIEVRETPAELVPDTRNWLTYRNSFGEADRFARVGLNGESELEIVTLSNGSTLVKEAGYDTVVGVRSGVLDFVGNNFAPGTAATVVVPRYAELRQSPQPNADIIITIPRGDIADVLDRVGNPSDGFIWYQVIYNGSTGWVRGDTLAPA